MVAGNVFLDSLGKFCASTPSIPEDIDHSGLWHSYKKELNSLSTYLLSSSQSIHQQVYVYYLSGLMKLCWALRRQVGIGYILRSVHLTKGNIHIRNIDTVKAVFNAILKDDCYGAGIILSWRPWCGGVGGWGGQGSSLGEWNWHRMWETFWYIGGGMGSDGGNRAISRTVLGCVVDILETETLCAFRNHIWKTEVSFVCLACPLWCQYTEG